MAGPDIVMSAVGCVEGHREREGNSCHYRVAWAINPHMRIGAASPMRARLQLGRFAQELRAAGASLVELPFVHGAFDSVFAKDSALLTERDGIRRALLARPRRRERQREQRARKEALAARGFVVADAPGACFEGGDVVVAPDVEELFLGYGFRSERRAARALERHMSCPVRSLRLVHPLLYHLDLALAVLSDGTALVCREAFDEAGLASLQASPAIERIVFVPLAEALSFALNLVEIGDRVIADGHSPTMARALAESGRTLRSVELSEFRLAGGSAACLVAVVHQPLVISRQTTAIRSMSA
ncbi:MAG: amidinotransferase family protein [Myxococcales bacterium]|nr:amidinotransferase family protein [Myxococcales bacterium]